MSLYLFFYFTVEKKMLEKALPIPQVTEFVNVIQSYKLLNGSKKNEEKIDDINKVKENNKSNVNFDFENKRLSSIDVEKCIKNDEHQCNNNYYNPSVFINNKNNYTLDKLREKIKNIKLTKGIRNLNESDKMLIDGATSETVAITKQINTPETMNVNPFIPTQDIQMDYVKESKKSIQTSPSNDSLDKYNDSNNYVSNYKNDSFSVKIPNRIHIPKSKVKIGYLYKVNDCFYSHDGFFLYRVPGIGEK